MKLLYVVHNHPTLHPGGAEAYALELYEAMRETPGVEPVLLARIGSNVARNRVAHPGTPFSSVNGDPDQYFVFTETDHFDFFTLTSRDKSLYSQHLTDWYTFTHVIHGFAFYALLWLIGRRWSVPARLVVAVLVAREGGRASNSAKGHRRGRLELFPTD